jgi:hypothetical protein
MKQIEINGQILYYKILNPPFNPALFTYFYIKDGVEKYKRFKFFGKELEKDVYKQLFFLSYNVESLSYSKEKIREDIEQNLRNIERLKEIEKGQII